MLDRVGGGFKDYVPLAVRLGLATIFILLGAQMVDHMGGHPSIRHIVTMVVQLLGGLFCLIGFLTRWAAFALGAFVLWQIVEYHGFHVIYRESDQLWLALLILCFASFGLGGGKYSLDEKQKKKDG
jgi:uncharacterized membrane protein YphA (DoxX/SURF4 family)